MLVSCAEMAASEERLFSSGIDPEPFMDEAGRKCAEAILDFCPLPGRAAVFVGKGNNGGDALVVARHLQGRGWSVDLHFSHPIEECSELCRKKSVEFDEEPGPKGEESHGGRIVVDGLLGIGASGNLRGPIRKLTDEIGTLRRETFATCFALDIPTGFNADTGEACDGAVVADATLSITAPKIGFAMDEATPWLGRLVEIPLDIPVSDGDESRRFLFPSNLAPRLSRRPYDFHKGDAGRVTILAGSRGMTGAAVLAATGASVAGAGLVTLCVPDGIYPIVASSVPPEVMVRPVSNREDVEALRTDVFAIGPGLGENVAEWVVDLICESEKTVVVDADGLNALAARGDRLSILPPNRILTPHPGELARMSDDAGQGSRSEVTRRLADEWGVTLLHKGARTVIATPGEPLELNTTGHPGMASGGMGDVLTGVIAAFVAQGVDQHAAACIGSWLLGRAAELGTRQNRVAMESITASQVADLIGAALQDLKSPLFQ